MDILLQLVANGVVRGALIALLAVGFGLVFRSMSLFHIAYAGIYVVASYLGLLFIGLLGLPALVGLAFAAIGACIAGYLIERLVYRPLFLRDAPPLMVFVASLGTYIILENLMALVFGNETRMLATTQEPTVSLGPVAVTRIMVIQLLLGIVLCSVFLLVLRKVRVFKVLWVMADEPALVTALGLPFMRLRALVLVCSSLFAAAASLCSSWDTGVQPGVGMGAFLSATVAVLIGGSRRYAGWLVGALVLGMVQSLTQWWFSARWVELVTFSLLVTVLLLRPDGLLGLRLRAEEK